MLNRALFLLILSTFAEAKDYQSFVLPKKTPSRVLSEPSYRSGRVEIKKSTSQVTPSVRLSEYMSARMAFLSEKRDESIRLLRQQLDSGLNANRDNLLLRLGQLYAEKYMELGYLENELYAKQVAEYEKKQAKKRPAIDNSRSKAYLKDATAIFYKLEKEFPKHPQLDEVLFFIGFVETESGHPEKGSAALERVVRQYPKSRKFEEAVIHLGDYYFEKYKFREALSKYKILAEKKGSELGPYSSYKMAWCEFNLNEHLRALTRMKQLIKSLENTDDKAKFNLRGQALKDCVVFFAEAGSVQSAEKFFVEAQGKEKALENLKLLAEILRTKAKDEAAVDLYENLIKELGDSADGPALELGRIDSLYRLGKTENSVKALVGALAKYGETSDWRKNFGKKIPQNANNGQEQLRSEGFKAALLYHQSAQNSSNRRSYDFALRIYEALWAHFPSHSDRKKVAFYRGDILYVQEKWFASADSFMEAAQIAPKDKVTDEAVYSALLALDHLTPEEKIPKLSSEESEKDLKPQKIPTAQKKFIEVAEFYLTEYPQGDRAVDVQFRIAAIYHKFHHFEEAEKRLLMIVQKHPTHRSATTAAHIVLDIRNAQKDFEGLESLASQFSSTAGLGDKVFKTEMANIKGELNFKKLEKFEKSNDWEKAGGSYLSYYREHPNGDLAEKSLYNSIISFEKAQNRIQVLDASKLFLSKFPKSERSQKVLLVAAKISGELYDYESAQARYHEFYKKYPKDAEAHKALYNAGLFAEILERNREAIEIYLEFLKGRVPDAEREAIQVSLAKLYRKLGDWQRVASIYRTLSRGASIPEKKLLFLAELAFQYERAGKLKEKKEVLKELGALSRSSGTKLEGLTASYVAEAAFDKLGVLRQKYDEIRLRFPPEDLVFLLKKKEKLLTQLSKEYDQIVEVGIPEWGVAALYEKSQIFSSFVKGFRSLQIPKSYEKEIRTETEAALKALDDKMVKPLESVSEQVLLTCVARAVQFRVASSYANKCRSNVARLEGATASGLLPQPSFWSTSVHEGMEVKEAPSIDDKDAYIEYLSSLDSTKLNSDTERKIRTFIAKHPEDKRAVFLLAVHYLRGSRKGLAHYLFQRLENENDFVWSSGVLNNLGLLALQEKNRLSALNLFEKAVKARPTRPEAFVNLGSLYLAAHSYSDAEKLFRQAVELGPDFEDAALGLGSALEGLGKFEEAHSIYSQFEGDHTKTVSTLYNEAVLLGNRLNKKEEAAKLMARYLQQGGKETAKAHQWIQNWR